VAERRQLHDNETKKRKVFLMHKKEILEKIKSQMLEDNTAKFNIMR
jgi:hypothetical protein